MEATGRGINDGETLGTVAIIGLGLIGGSIGLALRQWRAADRVIGWDTDASTLQAAVVSGALDEGAETTGHCVHGADIVVLAAPVSATISLLHAVKPYLTSDCVVTDVGSTKRRIVEEAEEILPGRFVGGHPMAGSEKSGLIFASPTLFDGAVWALTPSDNTEGTAYETAERLVRLVGAHPHRCSPDDHDRAVAFVSHLPHLLAYGLAQVSGEDVPEELRQLAAGSFRDGTRVAQSDPAFWAEILLDNPGPVLEALGAFASWTDRARKAIEAGDHDTLSALLDEARRARGRFPR
jgi:prephenate dehydrogenase